LLGLDLESLKNSVVQLVRSVSGTGKAQLHNRANRAAQRPMNLAPAIPCNFFSHPKSSEPQATQKLPSLSSVLVPHQGHHSDLLAQSSITGELEINNALKAGLGYRDDQWTLQVG